MNLLFVIDNLDFGGAQRQMVNLACGLKYRGHDISFFTYYPINNFQDILQKNSIPVYLASKKYKFSLMPAISLFRLMRNYQYDIVLSFLDTPNFYAEIANIGINGSRLVVSERFMYLPGKLSLKLWLLQQFHRLADAITVNSHHQRERMVNCFPWMKSKLNTIYNGLDLDAFCPKDGYVIGKNCISLIAIASVSFKKNALNLAKAISICKYEYNIDVHVDWVGSVITSKDGDVPFLMTKEYLKKVNLEEQWNWLGERKDISRLILEHDALIHPSFYEGLPNVICESLACGRPVLASNVCDHSRLVQNNISGLLFDPNDPASIAESINLFYSLDSVDRSRMGEKARDFAESFLSVERYVDEYENLFFKL